MKIMSGIGSFLYILSKLCCRCIQLNG